MAEQDEKTGKFLPGNKGNGGRRKGARNRLHADFVVALQEHFTEMGKAAIDIVFKESPKDYLKIIAAVLPKEFIIEDGRLESMSDEEIAEHLADIRRLKSDAGEDRSDASGGAKATLQ
ncbi:hypothetical protein [Bradyrhizobium sp. CB2312]|uniref:hypothetical protein n=1 Tax=Bradyrhizobium sp. CB2312 TaxID=3039155 RepID=UPI0024B09157|nr:hypothetical protein [Bradyrhizobium sp. CB2312]WFU68586.1 hypothetical protein QA642_24990 [Bradyrhizobium sp. CB2312]